MSVLAQACTGQYRAFCRDVCDRAYSVNLQFPCRQEAGLSLLQQVERLEALAQMQTDTHVAWAQHNQTTSSCQSRDNYFNSGTPFLHWKPEFRNVWGQ